MSEPAVKAANPTSEHNLPHPSNDQALPDVSNAPVRSSQDGTVNDEKTATNQEVFPKVSTPARSQHEASFNDEKTEEALLSVEEEALLLRQCRLCKVELVENVLDSGKVNSDFTFSNGDSLLITACKSGFKKLAKALMRRGAVLDAVDPDGNTAAHWCFAMGYGDLAEYLLSKGASDQISNKTGHTCRNWKSMGHAEEDLPWIQEPAAQSTKSLESQTSNSEPKKKGRMMELPSEHLKRQKAEAKNSAAASKPKALTRSPGAGSASAEPSPYQNMYLEPRGNSASPTGDVSPASGGGRKSKRRSPGSSAKRRMSSSPKARYLEEEEDRGIKPMKADEDGSAVQEGALTEPGLMPPVLRRNSNRVVTPPTGQSDAKSGRPTFPKQQFEEAVNNDPDAPKTLLTYNPKRAKGSGEEIKSPRSVEAMRRLGIIEDDLLEISKETLNKQYRGDTKVVEMRYKLYEERRVEDLERCVKERARMLARSRDASLQVLFAEFSGAKNTMTLADLLHLLETLTILSFDEWDAEPGKISKTRAVEIFKECATKRGAQYEVTWGEFVRMEKQIAAAMGAKSISTKAGLASQLTTHRSRAGSVAVSVDSVARRSMTGSPLPPEPTKMEDMLLRYEKLHQAELRRMKKHFSKVLDIRAKHSDFEQALRDKEQLRLERLEARTFAMAEQRVDQQINHVERLMLHEERLEKRVEEEKARIAKKEAEAKQLIEERTRRAQEKARMQAEMLQVKQEMTQLQRTQAHRKEEYLRTILHERLDKDRARAEAAAAQQEAMLKERSRILQKNRIDKKNFGAAAAVFEKTGELRMPQGIKDCGQFNELLQHQPEEDWEDRNPDAEELPMEVWTSRSVKKGCYAYFKVAVNPCKQIKFRARKPGHAELFLGNHKCPYPTREWHTWSKSGHDRITVMHLDPSFNLGFMYAGLFAAAADCTFSIVVTSIDSQTKGRSGGTGKPQTSVPPDSAQEQGQMDENRVLQRVKERVEALVEERLQGKGEDFCNKFRSLFGEKKGPGFAKGGKQRQEAGEVPEQVPVAEEEGAAPEEETKTETAPEEESYAEDDFEQEASSG